MITDEFASIQKRIHDYGFKRLLLAVSGGLDSICLAHYFIANRETLGIEWLGIAHVHHGLREGTADRDAAFVEAFAKVHNIPFFLKKLNGDALKNAEGSLEENAREARYKALAEIILDPAPSNLTQLSQQVDKFRISTTNLRFSAQDDTSLVFRLSSFVSHTPHLKAAEGCDLTPHPSFVIVTAHHAGDQAETIYMRLRRGTTLAGLRGIQEVRDNIFRPFLNVTREELLAYARENNLKWCEDESNSDVKFARNKVRHVYLPQLARGYRDAATQLCRIASLADKAYAKVMDKCDAMFRETLRQAQDDTSPVSRPSSLIALDKRKLRKIQIDHADADLSEMFRLWLSELGFRFPIGFFYDQKEPAHLKIPVRSAYRKRSIVKKGSTVLICEFKDVAEATKFVSCN
ncbi:tRNA lysidine(34) synthetase TilS [uncultured Fibrobacter sp.]|uniref:tRNA lysidine(34) synthetase TilS n=1 Tax=uncultured Fibrobacter sp. TaxID=261512 RepID=UPI00263733F0|nr:tRNA lysidine(34) synthetase TilS [uncultured Fibrobacter sp.]